MLTVNELFSGIGALRKALNNLGIEYEVVGISEIDKYAIASYEAMYGPVRNYGDISKVERLDYADLWYYSFPCTNISTAGRKEGLIQGKTASGLLYEVQRLLRVAAERERERERERELPKYLLMENVKNLTGKQFMPDFQKWLDWLDEYGYNSYWKVLDASDYGIPQHRERVFCISIRKDIDHGYSFPAKVPLMTCMRDFLEDNVPDSYYLSAEKTKSVIRHNSEHQGHIADPNNVCPTILSRDYKDPKVIQTADLKYSSYDYSNRVYSPEGVCPTLASRGYKGPKIIDQNTGGGGIEPKIIYAANLNRTSYKHDNQILSTEGICSTLVARGSCVMISTEDNNG